MQTNRFYSGQMSVRQIRKTLSTYERVPIGQIGLSDGPSLADQLISPIRSSLLSNPNSVDMWKETRRCGWNMTLSRHLDCLEMCDKWETDVKKYQMFSLEKFHLKKKL